MIKRIVFILILFISPLVAQTSIGTTSGSGSTKMEAYIKALNRLPGGAVPVNIGFNGSSTRSLDNKEYKGHYTCVITWKKY